MLDGELSKVLSYAPGPFEAQVTNLIPGFHITKDGAIHTYFAFA